MPTYNKLVRDRIPEIILNSGKTCHTRILDTEEYLHELHTKLKEETKEYYEAKDDSSAIEELADLLEVIRALASPVAKLAWVGVLSKEKNESSIVCPY